MSSEVKNSVLVVDDNEANTMVLSSMLQRMGFEVDEADSGLEAINHICKKDYDVVFMDHLMPEMDGIETIQQLLFISNGEKAPVVIGVSATIDEEVVEAFREAGAQDVLEKPVTMEKLEEKLASAGITATKIVEEDSSEEEEIGVILSAVDGLDYNKGLDMLGGSVENYMRVLAVCIKNIQDNYHSIDLIKNTRQAESLALHFHSLKGIFLNIGGDTMAERSRELEMAAKDGQLEWIQKHLADYLADLDSFQTDLQKAYEKYAQKKQEKQSGKIISASEFMTDLEELRQHIEDFEYIEITEKLEEMLLGSQGKQKEDLEKISDAIQDFDYDKAMQQLELLKEGL